MAVSSAQMHVRQLMQELGNSPALPGFTHTLTPPGLSPFAGQPLRPNCHCMATAWACPQVCTVGTVCVSALYSLLPAPARTNGHAFTGSPTAKYRCLCSQATHLALVFGCMVMPTTQGLALRTCSQLGMYRFNLRPPCKPTRKQKWTSHL